MEPTVLCAPSNDSCISRSNCPVASDGSKKIHGGPVSIKEYLCRVNMAHMVKSGQI